MALTPELQQEMREWLTKLPWNVFLTVTYRDARRAWHAQSCLNSIHKKLSQFAPQTLFLGTEEHKNQSLHVHGIMQTSTIAPPLRFVWRALFDAYGRSKVELIKDRGKVIWYCSKYVTKNLGEWNIW